jgi:hypothetical protein
MFPPIRPNYLSSLAKLLAEQKGKHKVFVSYYHQDDEYYRIQFEQLFGHLFINKSVKPGDIDTDISTDYIKKLIQDNHISDASVLAVLVGPKTYCRKHVDWEMSAALNKKVNGYSGLIGLVLPTHPAYYSLNDKYDESTVPERLNDNVVTGYAKVYRWTEDSAKMEKYIEEAFNARIDKNTLIDNSRIQYQKNRCVNGTLQDLFGL